MKERRNAATLALIGVNMAVFVLVEIFFGPTSDTTVLRRAGGQVPSLVVAGEYWRLFSAMFLHAGIRHLLSNMLLLYVLGEALEGRMGRGRYLALYLLGGLSGSLIELAVSLMKSEDVVSVGASGAVFSIMGALVWVLIKHRGRVSGLSLRQILVMLVLSVFFGFISEGVANEAHIGGLISGFLLAIILYRKDEEKA